MYIVWDIFFMFVKVLHFTCVFQIILKPLQLLHEKSTLDIEENTIQEKINSMHTLQKSEVTPSYSNNKWVNTCIKPFLFLHGLNEMYRSELILIMSWILECPCVVMAYITYLLSVGFPSPHPRRQPNLSSFKMNPSTPFSLSIWGYQSLKFHHCHPCWSPAINHKIHPS
jgi:hypothetical protein